jgi:hypothetical protein
VPTEKETINAFLQSLLEGLESKDQDQDNDEVKDNGVQPPCLEKPLCPVFYPKKVETQEKARKQGVKEAFF